jgi:ubiquinone/menaquinone biosynthesis C-methylase UbiE
MIEVISVQSGVMACWLIQYFKGFSIIVRKSFMSDKIHEFDTFSEDYRIIHNKNLRFSGAESDYFCEHKILEIKKQEGSQSLKLLDFGCGDGLLSKYFLKHFPSGSYSGIDVSPENIKQALLRKQHNSSFNHYPGNELPFEDKMFDIAIAANVFHHIDRKDHVKTIMEISRTLKPGGRFYIFEHNPVNPVTQLIVKTCIFDKKAKLLLPFHFKRYFHDSRMSILKIKYLLFFPRYGIFKRFFTFEEYLWKLPFGAQYLIIGQKDEG